MIAKKNIRSKNMNYGLDLTKLQDIQKQLGHSYIVQVGVLGDKAQRENIVRDEHGTAKKGGEESSMTNADIGVIHEFGSYSRNIPQRSFLWMPLVLKFPGIIKRVGQSFINGLTVSNIKDSMKGVGVMAEKIIAGAFSSGGYGRWPDIKQSTKDRKNSSTILIDSAQLKGSIASRVVTK